MSSPWDLVLRRLLERGMNPLERTASKPGITRQATCLCPAHEDRSPSLSVSQADDGRILMFCHAGCEASDVVEALGLSMADLFPPPDERGSPGSPQRSGGQRSDPRAKLRRLLTVAQNAVALDLPPGARKVLEEIGASAQELRLLRGGALPARTRRLEGSGDVMKLPARIVIPSFDEKLDVTGLYCRSIGSVPWVKPDGTRTHKWNASGSSNGVLAAHLLLVRPDAPVLLCAGGSDLLAAARHLPEYVPISFLCGEGSVPEAATTLLRGRTVTVAYDADAAGRAGTGRVGVQLRGSCRELRTVPWPADWGTSGQGKDLRDFLRVHGANAVRDLVGRAAPMSGGSSVDSVYGVEGSGSAEWTDPIPLARPLPPPFPVEAFHDPALRMFVEEVAEAFQVPLDLAAALVLANLSAAIAPKVEVELSPEWVEQVNLYVLLLLPTGERKSPPFEYLAQPLREIEREEEERVGAEYRRAKLAVEVLERRLERAMKEACDAEADLDLQAAIAGAERIEQELVEARRRVPVKPRIFCDNVTAEKCGSLLSEHGGSMAAFSDEGTFVQNAFRYSSKGDDAKIENLLKSYGGEEIRVDRSGRESEMVHRPCLTIAVCVQPTFLQNLPCKEHLRGRGLLGRFLCLAPKSRVGWRSETARPISAAGRDTFRRIIRSLVSAECGRSGAKEFDRHRIRLAPEAERLRAEFAAEVEKRMRPDGDLSAIQDWVNKSVGRAVRLAALLHLAGRALAGGALWDDVPDEAMAAGISIVRHGFEHYVIALGMLSGRASHEHAAAAWEWIGACPTPTFKVRDLYQSKRRRFGDDMDALESGLAELERRNFIRPVEAKRQGSAGRLPGCRSEFEINPKARLPDGPEEPKPTSPGGSPPEGRTQNTQNEGSASGEGDSESQPPEPRTQNPQNQPDSKDSASSVDSTCAGSSGNHAGENPPETEGRRSGDHRDDDDLIEEEL